MKLYKYVSANLWSNVLQDKLIRFSPAIAFNDPFEMQPYYESLRNNAEFQKSLNEAEVKATLEEFLVKEHANLPAEMQEAFSIDFLKSCAEIWSPFAVEHAPHIVDGFMPIINNAFYGAFNENIGVLALSEKCDNLLMWAHYAQSHTGLVIGFDGQHEYFHQQLGPSDEFRHIRKVRYSDLRPTIDLTTVEDATDILLTKSIEWSYEQEWRMMRPLEDVTETRVINNETIHLFSFPAACVQEVILGYRTSITDKDDIVGLLRNDEQYNHVKLYDAVIDRREYKLNVIPTDGTLLYG
jgi:hypothetical protein